MAKKSKQKAKGASFDVPPVTVTVTACDVEVSPTFKTAPYRHMLALAFLKERRWAMSNEAEQAAERAIAAGSLDAAEDLYDWVERLRLGEWPPYRQTPVGYEGQGLNDMPAEWQEKALAIARKAWKAFESLKTVVAATVDQVEAQVAYPVTMQTNPPRPRTSRRDKDDRKTWALARLPGSTERSLPSIAEWSRRTGANDEAGHPSKYRAIPESNLRRYRTELEDEGLIEKDALRRTAKGDAMQSATSTTSTIEGSDE